MDIMRDGQPVVARARRAARGDVPVEPVLGVLDLCWRVLVVVVGVDVEVGDVVTQVCEVGFAPGRGGAAGEGGAHVGGEETKDVAEGGFELVHLVFALLGGYGGQV